MKKITFIKQCLFALLFLFTLNMSAQSDYIEVLTGASTSTNGRAPQSGRSVSRSVFLITQAEMTAVGFSAGNQINALSFYFSIVPASTVAGNMTVYMQNSTDATNTKSLTWADAIAGMTTTSSSTVVLPNVVGDFNVPFSGGTTFTYTGGSIYIAFDYQNLSNPVSATLNTAFCNTTLINGLKGTVTAEGVTTPPTTIVASNFRPIIKLGKPSACSMPISLTFDSTLSTLNSATVSWNSTDGGSAFEIEYGPYGFIQGAGTTVTATSNQKVLTGLLDSTVYDFYVRKNCGSGVFSNWNGSSFSTLFTPSTPTYNTSFEQENLNFIGWATPTSTLVNGDWSIGNYGAGALVQSGTHSAYSITPTTGAANNFMFSRGLNLTAGSTVTVSFYVSNYVSGTTNPGSYQLTWGTAQTIAAQTNIIATQTGVTQAAFTLKTYTFVPTTTGVYYLGVKNTSPLNPAGTHAVIIDNFTVSQVLATQSFLNDVIKVYPNPVNSVLSIDSNNSFEVKSIAVTDINGRIVKNQIGSLSQINLSDLNTGIYFVKIETNEGSVTKKITKN